MDNVTAPLVMGGGAGLGVGWASAPEPSEAWNLLHPPGCGTCDGRKAMESRLIKVGQAFDDRMTTVVGRRLCISGRGLPHSTTLRAKRKIAVDQGQSRLIPPSPVATARQAYTDESCQLYVLGQSRLIKPSEAWNLLHPPGCGTCDGREAVHSRLIKANSAFACRYGATSTDESYQLCVFGQSRLIKVDQAKRDLESIAAAHTSFTATF